MTTTDSGTEDIREAFADVLDRMDLWPDPDQAQPDPEDPRADFIAGLHQLADFLADHPAVPLPYLHQTAATGHKPGLYLYLLGAGQRDQLAAITRAMAEGGTVHKYADPDPDRARMCVRREFAGLALVAQADREEVCERVVVGTETVEVEEPACPECGAALEPDTDPDATRCSRNTAHYRARQPGKRTATAEREIVEWRCTPLLAGQEVPA